MFDNRTKSRSMKFKIEGIEGEFESFWSTYNLYFCGLVEDGKERIVNYKVYDLDENLDLDDENIWNPIDIIYEDYVISVRDFKRVDSYGRIGGALLLHGVNICLS